MISVTCLARTERKTDSLSRSELVSVFSTLYSMEVWSAYNCQESVSYSGATHVQVGPFRAEKKSVSVKASELSASADGFGEKVSNYHMFVQQISLCASAS